MKKIKVSIVVPIHNTEKYLDACLESIINQTLEDVEIICVNDGSTDGSLAILEKFSKKDERMKVISTENSGYGHAMNVGIDNAVGEYIGFVDSDDFILSDKYSHLYQIAKEFDVDFVKADYFKFTGEAEDMVIDHIMIPKKIRDLYGKVINPKNHLDVFRVTVALWSGIYNRSFLNRRNIRLNETPGGAFQDIGFMFKALCWAEKILFINKPLHMYRKDNPDSQTLDTGKAFAPFNEFSSIRNFKDNNDEIHERFIEIFYLRLFHSYSFHLKRINDEHKFRFIEKFSEELSAGKEAGHLNESLFTKNEWKDVQILIDNPQKYLLENYFHSQEKANNNKIEELLREVKATKQAVVEAERKRNSAERKQEIMKTKMENSTIRSLQVEKTLQLTRIKLQNREDKIKYFLKQIELLQKDLVRSNNRYQDLKKFSDRKAKELTELQNSFYYKMGRVIFGLPFKIYKLIKKQ